MLRKDRHLAVLLQTDAALKRPLASVRAVVIFEIPNLIERIVAVVVQAPVIIFISFRFRVELLLYDIHSLWNLVVLRLDDHRGLDRCLQRYLLCLRLVPAPASSATPLLFCERF